MGPHGFQAYQTYFTAPANGAPADLAGLWYSFRAGSVKVIAVNNDDVCLQDAGDVYVHGYSGGAQKAWPENELASARRDRSIDWIVVCMHQVAMSTAMAPPFNGIQPAHAPPRPAPSRCPDRRSTPRRAPST